MIGKEGVVTLRRPEVTPRKTRRRTCGGGPSFEPLSPTWSNLQEDSPLAQ